MSFAPGFSSDIVESSGEDDDCPTVTFAALTNSWGADCTGKLLMSDRAQHTRSGALPRKRQLPNGIPNDIADRMSRGGR